MTDTENKWQEKWQRKRKFGRFQYAVSSALLISAILAVACYLGVYLTKYPMKISHEKFGLIVFLVLYIYKFLKHYFIDWPKNESKYNNSTV